jgi:hypothetical protein
MDAGNVFACGRQWREDESSPVTGNLSARPAGKPGSFFVKERLRRSLVRHCPVATAKHPESSRCVFEAWRNLSGPMWFQNQNQTLGRGRAASRWSAPSPGSRTRREDRAPSHRPQMSSAGYSLIGLLASIARLRFTGTRNLTCTFHKPRQKGTFLLCQQGDISTLP